MNARRSANLPRHALVALALAGALAIVVSVAGDGERSDPIPVRETPDVKAGDGAAADAPKSRARIAVPQDPPIVGDLGNDSLRAWIEQRSRATESKPAAAPRAAPTAARPPTRRIEFDTPDVRIVNPTSRWVFIPNPEKMTPPPQDPQAQ